MQLEPGQDTQEFLQSIVDTVREPMLVLDNALRVISANRSFYVTFEASPEEMEGRLIYDLGNGQWDIPALRQLLEDILPANNPFNDFEMIHDFPRAGRKIMHLNARALYRAEDSQHHDLILLAIEDITERRRAEARIRQSDEHLRLLVEGAKDYAIFMMDPDGRIITWNTGAERILGFSEGEVFGESSDIIFLPDDRARGVPQKELRTAAREGRAEDVRWHVRKDGTPFFAEGVVTALRDDEGNLRGFGKVLRDATERRKGEEERAELVQKVAVSVLKQREFLRDILRSVSEGKLNLCDSEKDLPAPLPAVSEPIALSAPSIRQLRQATVKAALAASYPLERWQDLETAVGEAAMNAVVHGGGGVARVHADEHGSIQIWITDRGKGIAMESLHRATLERGFTTAGTLGHGFSMLLRTADRVFLLTGAGGTTVVLQQEREASHEPAWLRNR